MDKHSDDYWMRHPGIGMDSDRGILEVNGRIIDLSTIIPAILADYMALGEEAIDTQLYEMNKENIQLGDTFSRPSVLLGRMAVLGEERSVFTDEGLEVIEDDDITKHHLAPRYQDFWAQIEETRYTPEVQRNMFLYNSAIGGTWLGVRKKDH